MIKIIAIQGNITVVLKDGTVLSKNEAPLEFIEKVFSNKDDEDFIRNLFNPEQAKLKEEYLEKKEIIDFINEQSNILSISGTSVYIRSVSELSLPEDLVIRIVEAEKENNKELIETYVNFWTLASLNPDSRARTNLFWFLTKYGFTISRSGLFVAFRGVEVKEVASQDSKEIEFIRDAYIKIKTKLKKSPKNYYLIHDELTGEYKYSTKKEEDVKTIEELYQLKCKDNTEKNCTIYTDAHTRSFNIKLGEMVSMKRQDCDSRQERTCSSGLHVASLDWLKENDQFGQVKLMVLVNPADVVAVPPQDSYGKMRTCAYYPIHEVSLYDEESYKLEDGFVDDFLTIINKNLTVNNDETTTYTLNIPIIPELNRNIIIDKINQIQSNLNKVVD
jgi:hypothetical protein